jgi:hypothetical protein
MSSIREGYVSMVVEKADVVYNVYEYLEEKDQLEPGGIKMARDFNTEGRCRPDEHYQACTDQGTVCGSGKIFCH